MTYKGGGAFLPKYHTDKAAGCHPCFQRNVAFQTMRAAVAKTARRTGVGWQDLGLSSPLTAHSGPGYNLDTSLTTSDFLL